MPLVQNYASFAHDVLNIAKRDANEASRALANSLVLQKWEYPVLSRTPAMKVESKGDRMVTRINEALAFLDENGYERSSQQRQFHAAFMQSSYKMLYREELHRHLTRLLRENRCSELRTEVACMTPRRFGKTFSIAMWCAAWLVVAQDHDSSIYSTSSRVSKMLLNLILHMAGILQQKFGGSITRIGGTGPPSAARIAVSSAGPPACQRANQRA